jgi:hypothetical protein
MFALLLYIIYCFWKNSAPRQFDTYSLFLSFDLSNEHFREDVGFFIYLGYLFVFCFGRTQLHVNLRII